MVAPFDARWPISGLAGLGTHLNADLRWASWSNSRSFWPTRADLLQGVLEAGFPVVFEQYDFLAPDIHEGMTNGLHSKKMRGVFWGLR